MKILAIDPGTTQSAYVIYDTDVPKILEAAIVDNNKMLQHLHSESAKCNKLIIEMIASYGMPVGKTVFESCVWIGRFIQKWADGAAGWNPAWYMLYRREVKMHLCGSMRAKDGNIRAALIDKFGEPPTKKRPNDNYPKRIAKDEWAALAVAVTYAETKMK